MKQDTGKDRRACSQATYLQYWESGQAWY